MTGVIRGGAPDEPQSDEQIDDGKEAYERVFPVDPYRHMAWNIVTNKWFDRIILVCIAINSFFMAIEVISFHYLLVHTTINFIFCQDPVKLQDDENDGRVMYFKMNYDVATGFQLALLWVFTIESLMKNIAYSPWY